MKFEQIEDDEDATRNISPGGERRKREERASFRKRCRSFEGREGSEAASVREESDLQWRRLVMVR